MPKKTTKEVILNVVPETPLTGEALIRKTAEEIEALIMSRGLGMQAVIQIFEVPKVVAQGNTESSHIILPGSADDIPPAMTDAMRPVGDKIGR